MDNQWLGCVIDATFFRCGDRNDILDERDWQTDGIAKSVAKVLRVSRGNHGGIDVCGIYGLPDQRSLSLGSMVHRYETDRIRRHVPRDGATRGASHDASSSTYGPNFGVFLLSSFQFGGTFSCFCPRHTRIGRGVSLHTLPFDRIAGIFPRIYARCETLALPWLPRLYQPALGAMERRAFHELATLFFLRSALPSVDMHATTSHAGSP